MKNILFGFAAVAAVAGSVNADVLDPRVPMDKPTYNVVKKLQVGTVYVPARNTTQVAVVLPVESVKLPKVGGRQVDVVAGVTSGRYPNDEAGLAFGLSTRVASYQGWDLNGGWAWTSNVTGPDALRTSAKGGALLTIGKKY
jgi:hypothetical protein